MKKLIFWGTAVLAAVLAGLISAHLLLRTAGLAGSVKAGSWSTNLTIGSEDAGLYTRAMVALYGLLALSKDETIYYTAQKDDAGDPLSGDCTYRLEGRNLDARWWSITAYGPESYLMETEEGRYSLTQTGMEMEGDGSFTAIVSAEPHEGNWLPVKRGQSFDMTVRFYNPGPSIYEKPEEAPLPRIVKEGCQ